jgi:hypothetical protein
MKYRNRKIQQNGEGALLDLIKVVGPHLLPLISKLLEKPTQEVSEFLGKKLKGLTGGAYMGSQNLYNQQFHYNVPVHMGKGVRKGKGEEEETKKKKLLIKENSLTV